MLSPRLAADSGPRPCRVRRDSTQARTANRRMTTNRSRDRPDLRVDRCRAWSRRNRTFFLLVCRRANPSLEYPHPARLRTAGLAERGMATRNHPVCWNPDSPNSHRFEEPRGFEGPSPSRPATIDRLQASSTSRSTSHSFLGGPSTAWQHSTSAGVPAPGACPGAPSRPRS